MLGRGTFLYRARQVAQRFVPPHATYAPLRLFVCMMIFVNWYKGLTQMQYILGHSTAVPLRIKN